MLLPSLVGYCLEVYMWPSLMIVILPLSTKLWLESHIVSNGVLLCSVHFLIQLPGNMRMFIIYYQCGFFFLPKCNNMECWRLEYITEKDKLFFVYSLNTFVLQMCEFFPPTPSNSPVLCGHQLGVLHFSSVLTLPAWG